MSPIVGVLIAYLAGSIPSAYIAGKVRGVDLRKHGSGNLGATNVVRVLGAKIGKRVFDDGCTFTERRFVSIGDHCTLNAGSIVQCHSQEDGAFKSDRSSLGAGTTLGVGAFVHYGVQMGPRVLLEADSFLMKGTDVPGGSRWGGNPAMELEAPQRQSPPRPTPRIAHRTRSGRLPSRAVRAV